MISPGLCRSPRRLLDDSATMISPGLCRSPRRLLDDIYDDLSSSLSLSLSSTKSTMISPRLSLSLLDESAMNLLYEIKKKDGRTKRRRLVKRDNYNEAYVIQLSFSLLFFFCLAVCVLSSIGEANRKERLQPEECIPLRKTDSGDEATTRPPGVKAVKDRSTKPIGDAKDYEEFQRMWSLKKEDLTIKKELSKIKLLETLIGKEGPLADYEETLKKKLINELG
ncbi:hypothetical protein DY000_02018148 [Brassica cretica]|uniref:Uncharacterized protein n=1 Tax=Brassica cretica TaxID=69181 RepID=A0ABQ7D135_BRACR|nr:hypothetical protein DY000_02018148 [Brassica cretica]